MKPLGIICSLLVSLAYAFPMTAFGNSGDLALDSPDGKVRIRLSADAAVGGVAYAVDYRGKALISNSALGVRVSSSTLCSGPMKIMSQIRKASDTTYTVVCGKSRLSRDYYNELDIELGGKSNGQKVRLTFRAYDDGVAFRYRLPGTGDITIQDEETSFCVVGNPTAWKLPVSSYATPYEFYYTEEVLDNVTSPSLFGCPLLLKWTDGTCAAITEADLRDYAGMYLEPTAGDPGCLRSRLSPRLDAAGAAVIGKLPLQTPWRVILIGSHEGALIESNLVYNLNPPPSTTDTAWIKTGKTTFPWWNGFEVGPNVEFKAGLNTATMKHYIDFCSEAGIEYHSLDGLKNKAWYGGPIRPYNGADLTTALPGLDLPGVIDYAKQKNVRLRLWMHSAAALAQMEKAFPVYEEWGIEGVMCDFFDHDDQQTVAAVHRILALAMKHHLTVTLHNIYKPTGLHRTYPNLLAEEAVLNLEFNKWSQGSTPEHEVTVPFTRMLAGPVDFHSGSFHNVFEADFKPQNVAPMTKGTRARELARYVVYENYLPMMADYPAAYRGQPGLQFVVEVPTSWDETRYISGDAGKYVVLARRKGAQWYVGCMTNSEARTLEIDLAFLGKGKFDAEIFSDDLRPPLSAKALQVVKREVSAQDKVEAAMATAGGFAMRLTPKP